MKNKHSWQDVKVMLNGKEIKAKPIQYKPEPLTATYYFKRGNNYYFKTSLGGKFCIESEDEMPFKYGEVYNLNFN